MSEEALIHRIKQLEEEVRVLHMKDSTVRAINQLSEIAGETVITYDMKAMAGRLSQDLLQCTRAEENFYLRKRVRELESELSKALA